MVTGLETVGNDFIMLSDVTGFIRTYALSLENELVPVSELKCGHPIHTMQMTNFNRLFAVQFDDSSVCLTRERGFTIGFPEYQVFIP